MSRVNYAAMTNHELKRYFLTHRDDEDAFQAYLERRRANSLQIITKVGDPDFDEKLEAAIRTKLQRSNQSQQ